MCLRHRQGHSRRNQAKRNRSSRTILARPGRRAAGLGADQPLDGRGGPAVTMVAAWTALYRRCGARHVAYRRSGNQSRDTGRGCNGEYTCPKTFAKNSLRRRTLRRPATDDFPDSGHAAISNPCPEQRDPAGPCPRNRARLPSRAREDSRGSHYGQSGINPCGLLSRPDALEPKGWQPSLQCLCFH
jgi:hypothetical protein